jgi:hypothetical protein
MKEKRTEELENTLEHIHPEDFQQYVKDNQDSLLGAGHDFQALIRRVLEEKGMTQQALFLKAQIPEKYGYKLLSGEKKTRKRDVLLRLFFAVRMSAGQVQQALKKYGLPALYARIPRDALLLLLFNKGGVTCEEADAELTRNGFPPLEAVGKGDN